MSVTDKPSRRGFVAATASMLATFAASAAPIPLFGIYHEASGLSYRDLSVAAVGYFLGAVTALLILGRLSNYLGRRPVVLLSLCFAAAGSVVLIHVPDAIPLIVGRVLLGLACGLAASATAAFVVDNAPSDPVWLASAITSSAPMIGLTIGALGSGALIEFGPLPTTVPYLAATLALLTCGCLTLLSNETVKRERGVLASLRPTVALSKASRKLLPVASCIFVATWALGGFYQAFGPAMATEQLGSTNSLISALVFSSMMAPTAIGGPVTGRLSPANAQRLGMIVFAASVSGVVLFLRVGAVVPFLIASGLAAIAQGAVLTASTRALVLSAPTDDKAGVFALIYTICYSGAAIPSFLAGQLSETWSLVQIASAYAALAGLACFVTLFAARNS